MDAGTPSDIVPIHGLWMTPRSREDWAARRDDRAPGWEEVADHALDWALRNARGT